ncbi:MAG: OmpH family outer membrane protein [Vicingaceae bacterium]
MKSLLSLFLMLLTISQLHAQKVGYIDTDYILDQLPEYKDAQGQLDAISAEWQAQLEKRYQVIDQMYQDLQAEEILLTDDMKRKRIEEIKEKEQDALEYQKKKFGIEGELFKERQKLVKPLQEKVYKAIKEVARASGYAIMMDKAGSTTLIYTNPKYNKSDAVLKKLGYDVENPSEF